MLYKRELINSFETIGYSCCIMMSIVIGPKWPFYSCIWISGCLEQVLCRCCNWVELLVQRRLPDFQNWRRVTRHPLVFRGLTGSQRTPGFGASHVCYVNDVYNMVCDML